ncbi:energy transducer TonB [Ferrimonas balearica]|uniref:energy transducer TonB n=1 Tax=Ferrimonas balearica TaxID=44012 RepID=UPI001C567E1B|nr:energy transducer TonB [Ferrimonas balearica]MBW3139709.1 energy transducer TonB [Ferrimonas balearica]
MDMLNQRRAIPAALGLCAALLLSPLAHANNDDSALYRAYNAYEQAVEAGDLAQIAKEAERTYQIAVSELDETDPRTPTLAINLGSALENLAKRQVLTERAATQAEAFDAYQDALTRLETQQGEQSEALLDPLLGMAKTAEKPRQARSYYQRAIELSEGKPVQQATLQVWAFDQLKWHPETVRSAKAFLSEAVETLQTERPENDSIRLEAEFRQAIVLAGERRQPKAIDELERILGHFEGLSFTHPIALGAHTKLVELYQRIGEPELATAHCQAVGKMTPWQEDQEQVPLYRQNPKFPVNMARRGKGGYVIVAFNIDKQGFVSEPEVIESEGGEAFEKASLDALKEWRYAPRFEAGQPVTAPATVRLDFALERP